MSKAYKDLITLIDKYLDAMSTRPQSIALTKKQIKTFQTQNKGELVYKGIPVVTAPQ